MARRGVAWGGFDCFTGWGGFGAWVGFGGSGRRSWRAVEASRWGRARLGAVTGLDGGRGPCPGCRPVAVAVAAAVPVAGLGRLGAPPRRVPASRVRPASRCRGRCRSRRRGRAVACSGNRCRRRSRHRRRRCRRCCRHRRWRWRWAWRWPNRPQGCCRRPGRSQRATSRMASIAGTCASMVMSAGTSVSGCSSTVSPSTIVGSSEGSPSKPQKRPRALARSLAQRGPRVDQQVAVDHHEGAQQRHADERDQRTPVLDGHGGPSPSTGTSVEGARRRRQGPGDK